MKRLAITTAGVILVVLAAAAAFGQGTYTGPTYRASVDSYAGALHVPAVTWVERTVIFTFDATLSATHKHPDYAADIAAADSIVILSDIDSFAWAMLDQSIPADSTGYAIDAANINRRMSHIDMASSADYYNLTEGTTRRNLMFHVPFEDYIPAGRHIIDAFFKRCFVASAYYTVDDTLVATLMTNAADGVWFTSKGIDNFDEPVPYYAHCNWNYQIHGADAYGYPAASLSAWDPTVDNRTRFWDWGAASDMTGWYNDGEGSPIVGTNAAPTGNNVELTNCVQAAVNGATNNGINLVSLRPGTQRQILFTSFNPGDNAYDPSMAYFTVRYLERQYRSPFPDGNDVAFMFCTDDGLKVINEACAAEYRTHGGKWTMYIIGNTWAELSTEDHLAHPDSIVAWYNEGLVEPANHTYFHTANDGERLGGTGIFDLYDWALCWTNNDSINEYTAGMYPETLTAAATPLDSLMYDTDPEWMYYEFEQWTGTSWRAAANFGKTLGNGVWKPTPQACAALAWHDHYEGIRNHYVNPNTYDSTGARSDMWVTMYRHPAEGDTVHGGLRPNHIGEPRNLSHTAMNASANNFVVGKAENPSDAFIRYRMRMELEKARANKRRLLFTYTHATKAYPSYTSGIDGDEFGSMLTGCDDYNTAVGAYGGVWKPTVNEYTLHILRNCTFIDTPTDWVPVAAHNYTADQHIWGRVDGIGDSFIPGVKR